MAAAAPAPAAAPAAAAAPPLTIKRKLTGGEALAVRKAGNISGIALTQDDILWSDDVNDATKVPETTGEYDLTTAQDKAIAKAGKATKTRELDPDELNMVLGRYAKVTFALDKAERMGFQTNKKYLVTAMDSWVLYVVQITPNHRHLNADEVDAIKEGQASVTFTLDAKEQEHVPSVDKYDVEPNDDIQLRRGVVLLNAGRIKPIRIATVSKEAKDQGNYELALQSFQTEPAVLDNVIETSMRRVRQLSEIQAVVGFLEPIIGRRLTFTMADVAPIANAIRHRGGFKASTGAAKASELLVRASEYAALLGQAMFWKLRLGALVRLMQAWKRCAVETRTGQATTISRKLVDAALSQVNEWKTKSSASKIIAAGESKDLYLLLKGTADGFSEHAIDNTFASSGLVIGAAMTVLVSDEDGKGNLVAVIAAISAVHTGLEKTVGRNSDYVDIRKARRIGKKFFFTGSDKSTKAASYAVLLSAFRTNGRLFVKVN